MIFVHPVYGGAPRGGGGTTSFDLTLCRAWTSSAHALGQAFSHTNSFPCDLQADNGPSADAPLAARRGSAVRFGKFDYLGSRGDRLKKNTFVIPAGVTPAQRSTLKFFIIVVLLLLAQTPVGGATGHFPGGPEELLRSGPGVTSVNSNSLRTTIQNSRSSPPALGGRAGAKSAHIAPAFRQCPDPNSLRCVTSFDPCGRSRAVAIMAAPR